MRGGLWQVCVVGFRRFEWGITSRDAHEGEIKRTGQLWSPRATLVCTPNNTY